MKTLVTFLPFIVLIGAMLLMTRSAKNKQRAAATMRNQMQPGTGVRTIGGLYATVKEVTDDTVVVEISPGVHATFAKNAIGAVLEDEEYDRIVNGVVPPSALEGDETLVVPDSPADLERIDLTKDEDAEVSDKAADDADEDEADDVKDAKGDARGSKGTKDEGDEDGPAR